MIPDLGRFHALSKIIIIVGSKTMDLPGEQGSSVFLNNSGKNAAGFFKKN